MPKGIEYWHGPILIVIIDTRHKRHYHIINLLEQYVSIVPPRMVQNFKPYFELTSLTFPIEVAEKAFKKSCCTFIIHILWLIHINEGWEFTENCLQG